MKRTKITIETDEGEKVTCPRCHGKGKDPIAFPLQPCLKCHGKGWVWESQLEP